MSTSSENELYFPPWEILRAEETMENIPRDFSKKRATIRGLGYGLVIGVVVLINPVLAGGVTAFLTVIEKHRIQDAQRKWKEAKRVVAGSS